MADLRVALNRALNDVNATHPGLLHVGITDRMFHLADSDGHGPGVPFEWATAENTPHLVTEAVQEAAIEALWQAGRSPVWPACPDHPDNTHPLRVRDEDARLTWACPMTGRAIAAVGELAG